MKKIFSELYNELSEGRSAVLVELTASSGSTPRGAGAKMLVFSEESGKKPIGTVGGGKVEYLCTLMAQTAINNRQSLIKSYDLSIRDISEVGMICGGNVEAGFIYFSPKDKEKCLKILELFDSGIDAWLVTVETDNGVSMGTYDESNGLMFIEGIEDSELKPFLNNKHSFEYKGKKYFVEPFNEKGIVYVFGAGHVSRELVPLLEHIGFKTAVYEERIELLNSWNFPEETLVINGKFDRIDENVVMKESDYAVVMTSGHIADYTVLEQVLRKELSYTGVIGSRTKIAITRQKLLNAGIDERKIDKLHTPIGLAIKAVTPAEIAVSIAAELILHRAENRTVK